MKKSMISEFMEKESDSKNLFHVIKHVAPVLALVGQKVKKHIFM